jgi:hypothetical protein
MLKVRYHNDDEHDCVIRPTPFVSISTNILKNKIGRFGVTYTITLTGTLMPDEGTPYAIDPATNATFGFLGGQAEADIPVGTGFVGPYLAFDSIPFSLREKPPRQQVQEKYAAAILSKQKVLRALFARDGQRVEFTDIKDETQAMLHCNPRVVSIDFTEGSFISKAEYTIVLEADALYHGDSSNPFISEDGTVVAGSGLTDYNQTLDDLLAVSGTAFIEEYSEDWSIEVDDALGESIDLPRSYKISHNLNATGKTFFSTSGIIEKPAWQQARDFIQLKLSTQPSGNYPNVAGMVGSGALNLMEAYNGFNHVRTENINESAGSYGIAENWLLASGTATENYSMSTATGSDSPFVKIDINGTIKGLSLIPVSGWPAEPLEMAESGAWGNALRKYNQISNKGKFGLSSEVYKRANNLVAVQLNSQPLSISLGTNQFNGEITYALSFDNRPTNIISGVINETFSVNDTYPGDVFAVIPVLGRATGPIIQYIGGRTEYKRDVSLSLTMDYTKIPYGSGRETLLLKKPSLVEPTATQIANLIRELSPQGEFGVRKYFVSPPSESWDPKAGTYSFNISFTYELDR